MTDIDTLEPMTEPRSFHTTDSVRPLAVVTGASSGIGYELACKFAREGFDLVIAAENEGGLREAEQTLRSQGAQFVEAVAADLSTWDGVEKLVGAVEALRRPVAALCANAGVGVQGPFLETDLDDELKMIRLNVLGQVHLVKRLVRPMAELGHGRILITSSVAGVLPAPYMAVYAATKAFDRFFAEGLRQELKDRGVTVTALEPGPVDTNFFERADMMDTKAGQGPKSDPVMVAEAAFEALMDGKHSVLPGAMAKTLGATEHLPDTVRAKIHESMVKPQQT